jgi:hypothetical protein
MQFHSTPGLADNYTYTRCGVNFPIDLPVSIASAGARIAGIDADPGFAGTQPARNHLSFLSEQATELPLGAIQPRGWLRDQLRLQADGLTGHLEAIWPDVGPNSGWLGGSGESWERGPYYLDGLVPLAYTLGDDALIAKARPWIEWMLGSQDASGFFGPANNRDWWPRMVALKVLTQYADATGDERVVPFLTAYFRHQLAELPGNPLQAWGQARGFDNALSVWWLYRRTGEAWLLDLTDLLRQQTLDWETYLTRDLITGPARLFSHFTHGPNVAMGLKAAGVTYLRDGDDRHRETTEAAFAALDRWHGQAHGWFSGDEWLGGRAATAGIETCQVVELMFTLENLARIFSDGRYGDLLESVAYNLMPASFDPRMLAHQYHQQANQVRVSVDHRPWTYSSDDANIFGLEPHFGCCTANFHQGWPKLVRSSWVQDTDGGLRVVTYAPVDVSATIGGKTLSLTIETNYPFEEVIEIRIAADRPVDAPIRLRIPAWADSFALAINGEDIESPEVQNGYLELQRTWSSGNVIALTLPMHPIAIRREGQSAALRLGPLVLVYSPVENWLQVPGAPGLAEWEIHPRSNWNWGLDLRDIENWRVERNLPSAIPWQASNAVVVHARGAHVTGWGLDGAQSAPPPNSPILDRGPMHDLRLVPYGTARLRVTEFPVLGFMSPEF